VTNKFENKKTVGDCSMTRYPGGQYAQHAAGADDVQWFSTAL